MVERNLAKVEVASSRLVFRSNNFMNTTIIHYKPLIKLIDNFYSSQECDNILQFDWQWERSGGWNHELGATKVTDERTSSTVFVKLSDCSIPQEIKNLNYKLSNFLDIDILRLEEPQLTKYNPNEKYVPHWDYFSSGKQAINNRVATAIIYLNDNFLGGNTTFTLLNKSIMPKSGRLLYFEYDYTTEINSLTKHSGDIIFSGTKQIATVWIRKNNYKS